MKVRFGQLGLPQAAWVITVGLALASVACSDSGSSDGADSQGADSSGTDTAGGQGGQGSQGSSGFDFSDTDCPAGTTNQWATFAEHPACIELLEHNRDCQCVSAEDPAACVENYNETVSQTVSAMFCYPTQTPLFAIPAACDTALSKVEECE